MRRGPSRSVKCGRQRQRDCGRTRAFIAYDRIKKKKLTPAFICFNSIYQAVENKLRNALSENSKTLCCGPLRESRSPGARRIKAEIGH